MDDSAIKAFLMKHATPAQVANTRIEIMEVFQNPWFADRQLVMVRMNNIKNTEVRYYMMHHKQSDTVIIYHGKSRPLKSIQDCRAWLQEYCTA